MAMSTEVFASSPLVVVETRTHGVIDVSDDVQNVSVTRRLDAVSSASVTLNNYSSYSSGRYSGIINVGDRAHVSFYVQGQRVKQITGRVSRVPMMTFNEGAYKFTITDVIGDLQYIYWDPYSREAQDKYTGFKVFDQYGEGFIESSGQDGGIGTVINSFLQEVCGLPQGSVKVAKFPDLNDTVKNIIDAIIFKDDISQDQLEAEYQKYFDLIFGSGTDYDEDVSTDGSSNDGTSNSGGETAGTSGLSGTDKQKAVAVSAVKALIKIFGLGDKATANDWNANVKFLGTAHGGPGSTTKNWSQWDSTDHTGRYGLTKKQIKDTLGKNQEAWSLSRDDQNTAINKIMSAIVKGGSDDKYKALYFYLTGVPLKYASGSNPQIMNGWKLQIKGKEYTHQNAWTSLVDSGSKSVRSERNVISSERSSRAIINDGGPSSSSSDMNKGSTPKPKISADAQKKWDTFIGRYHAGAPSIDYDGFAGVQCWDLYLEYFKIITNGATKPWQPADGNPGYWKHQCLKEPATMANFNRIGAGSRAQKGDVCFWDWGGGAAGHVDIVLSDDGTTLTTIDQNIQGYRGIVKQMTWKSGDSRKVGFLRPKIFANGAPSGGASGTSEGADGGGSSGGAGSPSDPARSSAFALFKYVTFYNPNAVIAAEKGYTGEVALKNDQPTFDYFKVLCNASFRSFMSMPDGSIAAFVPDYFGFITKDGLHNRLDIPMVEVISFNSYFDKSSYVSHYYLVTNELIGGQTNDVYGMTSSMESNIMGILSDAVRSQWGSGTVTLEGKKADALFKLMNAKALTGCNTPEAMLQSWGVSVKTEQQNQIIDKRMTACYALFQMLKYWSSCFTSDLNITFKPEIMPGIRVRIPDAHVTLFVKAVTHSWDANSGGRTSITTVCPVTDDGYVGVNPS